MQKQLDDYLATLPTFEQGWVWLAGAGPGDSGLLTLHALHGLRCADVVVYDALVETDILDFANPEAEMVFAGKRGGKPSPKQADITEKLIAYAKQNKRVLRLKGGDPFVFGRGGEEALALVSANIRFRIIPGITAGVGGLAYAGMPLTHRDVNSAVSFITGHSLSGDVPDNLDWHALAKGSPVMVFYMALKHVAEITEKLLQAGRDADESAAIISFASTPRQEVRIGTLGNLVDLAAEASAPSIIVVGGVVDLRKMLNWFQP